MRNRRVAVVGVGADAGLEGGDELAQLVKLIVGQGFGGKEVKGTGVGVAEECVQHRQIVA